MFIHISSLSWESFISGNAVPVDDNVNDTREKTLWKDIEKMTVLIYYDFIALIMYKPNVIVGKLRKTYETREIWSKNTLIVNKMKGTSLFLFFCSLSDCICVCSSLFTHVFLYVWVHIQVCISLSKEHFGMSNSCTTFFDFYILKQVVYPTLLWNCLQGKLIVEKLIWILIQNNWFKLSWNTERSFNFSFRKI